MKILDRYILKEFFKSLMISMFMIYAILLIQFMIKLLDKFLGKGFSLSFLGELLFYNTAWIVVLAVPMAILVASILTYGKLSSNNEVIGFYSSGIKQKNIIIAPLIATIIITSLMIYFSCNILPNMNYKARLLNYELIKTRPDVEFEENIYSHLIPDHIIKFNQRDKNNKSKFYDILIHQIEKNNLKRTIIANSVIVNSNKEKIKFDLYDGAIHEKNNKDEEYRQINFENYGLVIPLNKINNTTRVPKRRDRELTFKMLQHKNDSLLIKNDYFKNKIHKRLALFNINVDTSNIDYNSLIQKNENGIINKHDKDSLNKITNLEEKQFYKMRSEGNKSMISANIKKINQIENKINKNSVEINKKFSIPIASIIFFIIGAPLGIKIRRGSIAMSMAISLMFFILYYILIVGGEQLADKNLFNPTLSMWLPNCIILLLGLFVLKIIKR